MLETANAEDADIIRRLAVIADLPESRIYARAAAWLGLAYFDVIPAKAQFGAEVPFSGEIAHQASLRGRLGARDVLFVAPGFEQLIALSNRSDTMRALGPGICVVPPAALKAGIARQRGAWLTSEATARLTRLKGRFSAADHIGPATRLGFALVVLVMTVLAVLAPGMLLPLITPPLAVIYLGPSLFRLMAALRTRGFNRPQVRPRNPGRLPVYSILVPLYDEAALVPQLCQALNALDYPRDKLDIKFVVEAESPKTIAAVEAHLDDGPFELIVVRDSAPRTKPKALNYALPFVRGEYLVVFDAEDVPEPDQLRLAIDRFEADPGLDCLQAELVVDNAAENFLTKMFASEYAAQFGLILPAIAQAKLPVPLGGSSNHLRVDSLLKAGGWDSHNVTEDADLGVRLARLGMRCETLVSATFEEAPVTINGWVRQRTRWMKGWMQTLLVHNRNPAALFRQLGPVGFLAFQIYVGGMALTAPVHAAFLAIILIKSFTFGVLNIWPADPWIAIHGAILFLGYAANAITLYLGLRRFGRQRHAGWLALLPLYWILSSIAGLRAAYQLFANPFEWEKTRHAMTRLPRQGFERMAPISDGK